MDASIRRLIVNRAAPFFEDGVIPQSWDSLPLTAKLRIQSQDSELAAVWSGKMTGDLEAKVLAGVWSDKPVEPRTEQEIAKEKEEAIQAAFAGLGPVKSVDELEADLKAKRAASEQARMNSLRMVGMG